MRFSEKTPQIKAELGNDTNFLKVLNTGWKEVVTESERGLDFCLAFFFLFFFPGNTRCNVNWNRFTLCFSDSQVGEVSIFPFPPRNFFVSPKTFPAARMRARLPFHPCKPQWCWRKTKEEEPHCLDSCYDTYIPSLPVCSFFFFSWNLFKVFLITSCAASHWAARSDAEQ